MTENSERDVNNTAEYELKEELLDDVSGGMIVIFFLLLTAFARVFQTIVPVR